VINLTINGQQRQLTPPISVLALLEQLELTGKRVAVERNGEIVPRSQHASVQLADTDHLEIVVAVGGG
jgi:sulfur carrier protein